MENFMAQSANGTETDDFSDRKATLKVHYMGYIYSGMATECFKKKIMFVSFFNKNISLTCAYTQCIDREPKAPRTRGTTQEIQSGHKETASRSMVVSQFVHAHRRKA